MGLSAGEATAVAKSWAAVYGNKDANGDDFLLQLFAKFPEDANFFAEFKGKSVGDLKGSPQLRSVSSRIMERLNEFVQNAGDAGKLSGLFQAFAKQHLTYGVRHHQYEHVQSMFGGFASGHGGGGADAAWSKLFGLLVEAFKHAEA